MLLCHMRASDHIYNQVSGSTFLIHFPHNSHPQLLLPSPCIHIIIMEVDWENFNISPLWSYSGHRSNGLLMCTLNPWLIVYTYLVDLSVYDLFREIHRIFFPSSWSCKQQYNHFDVRSPTLEELVRFADL